MTNEILEITRKRFPETRVLADIANQGKKRMVVEFHLVRQVMKVHPSLRDAHKHEAVGSFVE